MIPYIENPKDSTSRLLELIQQFGSVAGYKSMPRSQWHFYTLTMRLKKEIKESISFTIAPKSIRYRNTPNQRGKRSIPQNLQNTSEKNLGRHKEMRKFFMFMDWKY